MATLAPTRSDRQKQKPGALASRAFSVASNFSCGPDWTLRRKVASNRCGNDEQLETDEQTAKGEQDAAPGKHFVQHAKMVEHGVGHLDLPLPHQRAYGP